MLNQKDLIDRLFAVLDGLSNAAFAVALVQAVGAILLIANMVQVAAYTRRTEIGIMRLVGASRWYTQLPFLLEAVLAATIGVVLAIIGLIVVRALFLEKALNQFYQANLIAKIDYADILYISPCAVPGGRCDGRCRRRTSRCGCTCGGSAWPRRTAAEAKKAANGRATRIVATNRKARHNYSILDTFEAGVVLQGTEVKSLREGQASLADAFATVDDGEIWLRNLHIPEYHHGSWTNHAPRRNRKLLLHRSQIDTLVGKIRDGNLTLVPLSLYFADGKVKVELALARGKQAHDKRQDLAKRDARTRGHPRARQACEGHVLIGSLAGRCSRCYRRSVSGSVISSGESRRAGWPRCGWCCSRIRSRCCCWPRWPLSRAASSPAPPCCGAGCAA